MNEDNQEKNLEKNKYLIYIDKETYPFLVLYLFLIAVMFAYGSYSLDEKERKFKENNLCINRVFDDGKMQICIYDEKRNITDCKSALIYEKIKNISR